MALAQNNASGSALSMLLSLYMQGHIKDVQWTQMMELLDSAETSSTERQAFARFLNDVVSESGFGALKMPKANELNEVFAQIRHS